MTKRSRNHISRPTAANPPASCTQERNPPGTSSYCSGGRSKARAANISSGQWSVVRRPWSVVGVFATDHGRRTTDNCSDVFLDPCRGVAVAGRRGGGRVGGAVGGG